MNEETVTNKTLLELIADMRIVGHKEAARGQLEQAIFLWFHKDDSYVVSDASAIHTLTVAVQGILWAYAHDSRQRPSTLRQMIENMPPAQYAGIVDSQNFFKHGSTGRKEKGKRKAVSHLPDLSDFFLADNVCTFNRLFFISSPLLDMFRLRYSLSFPRSRINIETLEMKLVSSGHELEVVAALNRKAFYEFVAPYAVANLREQRASAIGGP
ncbi:MAG TPA: hypothetical protein VK581_01535 [Chthoniobacterales bacterium]|nr:hypothetical protein [Chthoniobacterales bacterium]